MTDNNNHVPDEEVYEEALRMVTTALAEFLNAPVALDNHHTLTDLGQAVTLVHELSSYLFSLTTDPRFLPAFGWDAVTVASTMAATTHFVSCPHNQEEDAHPEESFKWHKQHPFA